jgi:hypothetical protein
VHSDSTHAAAKLSAPSPFYLLPCSDGQAAKQLKESPKAAAANGSTADVPPAAAEPDAAPKAAAKPKSKRKTATNEPPGPMYDTGMRAPRYDGPAHRFISWNVAGMRALMKKDAESLQRLVEAEQVDAICLQVCALNNCVPSSCVKRRVCYELGLLPDR